MRFTKIKISKDKVRLEYEIQNKKGGYDEFTLNCSDEPIPEFRNTLQALDQDVIEICELPLEYIGRITVTGVALSYGGEKGVMGATLIAQMSLTKSNVTLNLNTPHKTEDFYAEDGDVLQLLPGDCVKRIAALIEEANDYVKGIRAQGELFSAPEMAAARRLVDCTKDGTSMTISSGRKSLHIINGKVTKDSPEKIVDPSTGEILAPGDLPDADKEHPFYNGKVPGPEGPTAQKGKPRRARA